MNRSEFLNKLREALENDLNAQAVQENIEYYDSYIRSEIKNGRTEQEILDMLGDPWVIARTIIINSAENERDYYGGHLRCLRFRAEYVYRRRGRKRRSVIRFFT